MKEKRCPKCSVIISINDKYCWNCGYKIKNKSKENKDEHESTLQ